MADDKKKGDPDKFVDKDGEGTTIRDEKGEIVKVDKDKKDKKASNWRMDIAKELRDIGMTANYAIAQVEDDITSRAKNNGLRASDVAVHLKTDDAFITFVIFAGENELPPTKEQLDDRLFHIYNTRFQFKYDPRPGAKIKVKAKVPWPL